MFTIFTKSVSHGVSLCKRWEFASSSLEWKSMDSINVISYYLNKCQTLSYTSQIFFFQEGNALLHMHCACNTVQLVRHSRLPFSWTMSPSSPELNALITRFRQSYCSVSISRKSKRLKKPRSDWLNSGNALIHHLSEKNAIFVFRRFARQCRNSSHLEWHSKASFDCLLYR